MATKEISDKINIIVGKPRKKRLILLGLQLKRTQVSMVLEAIDEYIESRITKKKIKKH